MRAGLRVATSRGVTAIHDKDGWLGALRASGSGCARGGAHAPRLAVAAARPLDRLAELGIESRPRRRPAPHRLPEGVHGRDARLADGAAARRLGRRDHERARAGRDRPTGRGSPASRSRCTRSATSRTATRSTRSRRRRTYWRPLGLRHRIEHAQCLRPRTSPRFAALGVAASVQFSHAPSDRDLADRWWAGQTEGAYAYRSLLDVGRRHRERIGRADRGARPAPASGRRPAHARRRGAWRPEQALTVEQALRATIVTPAWLPATSAGAASFFPAASPTWSSSTATRSRPRPESSPRSVVATMVGGRWVYNPPPWD